MKISTLALIAAAGIATPTLAAADDIPAPRIENGDEGKPAWAQLRVMSSAKTLGPGDADAPLRPAALKIAPHDWFTAQNPLVKAFLAAPEQRVDAAIAVRIGPDGRITECAEDDPSLDGRDKAMPLDVAAICDALRPGALYTPALDLTGQRTEGRAVITLQSTQRPIDPEITRPVPLFERVSLAEPPRPPRMIVASGNLTEFPPSFGWIRSKLPPTSYQQPVTWPVHEANWDGAGRVVGVLYSGEDIAEGNHAAFPRCSIIMSSHNAAADLEACRFVSEDVRPEWDDLAPTKPRMVAFLVNATVGKTRAVAASYRARQSADLIYEKSEEFQQAIVAATGVAPTGPTRHFTMKLRLDQTGQATHCQITTSSGSDAGDIAACKIAREGIWYTPDHDVFGRPVAGAIVTWYPY